MKIVLIILLGILFLFILPVLGLSYILYSKLLTRPRKAPRERVCVFPEEDEYTVMYRAGEKWFSEHEDARKPVSVKNGKLNLYGEYFDFGAKKAVVIIPGRTENCVYSAYFAEPYRAAGYNVLVIDNRSHGLSDGRVNSLGFKEYRDVEIWCRMLQDQYGIQDIWLHGVCIGCSCSLFVCTDPNRPEAIRGMTADGMFKNFYATTYNHFVERGKPTFPILHGCMAWIHMLSGKSAIWDGPVKRIKQMQLPILMLHSRKDTYSEPAPAQALYDSCPSRDKKLVWFDEGAHSRVRLHNTERYDETIRDYIARYVQ